jgi:hypothetical protein
MAPTQAAVPQRGLEALEGGRSAFRSRLEVPRVAVVLELGDHVIRDGVALVLGQNLLEAAHRLARAPQGEGYGVLEHFPRVVVLDGDLDNDHRYHTSNGVLAFKLPCGRCQL